jgi:hypothetical protein
MIKMSVSSTNSNRAIVENLNLNSTFGNSILLSLFSSLIRKNQELLSSNFNRDRSKYSESGNFTSPLIVSTVWGINTLQTNQYGGNSSFLSFAELNFSWLPRFFSPDVVSGSKLFHNENLAQQVILKNVSTVESCGILYEELESQLLTIMNFNDMIPTLRLSSYTKNKIKESGKILMRACSCVLAIW